MEDSFAYSVDPRQFVVCGIDEAGRGPLMGDVVAACVWLSHDPMIAELNDSKKLSEKKREQLAEIIKAQALAYGIGRASPEEIDKFNILNATYLAMTRAFDAMQDMRLQRATKQAKAAHSLNVSLPPVRLILIDGNRLPPPLVERGLCCEYVVKGDARVNEIAAASILAKTTRDADLKALDKQYPAYGFAKHKGYPTADHLQLLQQLEILPCYRRSFGPVRQLIFQRTGQDPLPQYEGGVYNKRRQKVEREQREREFEKDLRQGSLLDAFETFDTPDAPDVPDELKS